MSFNAPDAGRGRRRNKGEEHEHSNGSPKTAADSTLAQEGIAGSRKMRLWWRGPSKWGNPFRADVFGLERCLKLYEHSLGGCWTPSLILDLSLTMSSDVYQLHCDFLGPLHQVQHLRPIT